MRGQGRGPMPAARLVALPDGREGRASKDRKLDWGRERGPLG